jgi:hypothetical protein
VAQLLYHCSAFMKPPKGDPFSCLSLSLCTSSH